MTHSFLTGQTCKPNWNYSRLQWRSSLLLIRAKVRRQNRAIDWMYRLFLTSPFTSWKICAADEAFTLLRNVRDVWRSSWKMIQSGRRPSSSVESGQEEGCNCAIVEVEPKVLYPLCWDILAAILLAYPAKIAFLIFDEPAHKDAYVTSGLNCKDCFYSFSLQFKIGKIAAHIVGLKTYALNSTILDLLYTGLHIALIHSLKSDWRQYLLIISHVKFFWPPLQQFVVIEFAHLWQNEDHEYPILCPLPKQLKTDSPASPGTWKKFRYLALDLSVIVVYSDIALDQDGACQQLHTIWEQCIAWAFWSKEQYLKKAEIEDMISRTIGHVFI